MSGNLFSQPEFDLLDAETREWIDARSSFLLHQFGAQRIRTCPIILPTTEFFPRRFSKTEEGARELLEQLCRYLGIDSRTVELMLFQGGQRPDGVPVPMGVYEPHDDHFRIWVDVSQLDEPLELAATMIHELCHVHLLGHERLTEDVDDHEPLTDLTTVFLGLGIITANATLRDVSWRDGGMEGWQISARGYFTMPMYGYALALFSEVRHEDDSDWSKHLRPDVRHAFQKSLRFLQQHGLPELRSVQTTKALPCTIRVEPSDEPEVNAAADEEDESVVCTFCGLALPEQEDHDGVCDECRESIEENRAEIEFEVQVGAVAHQRSWKIIRIGFVLFVLVIAIFAVLEHIGVFE